MYSLYAVLIGFALDMLFGDPNFKYHPVRIIGSLISYSEKIIRGILPKSKNGEIVGGAVLAIFLCLFCSINVYFILHIIYAFNLYLGLIAEGTLCWMLIAARSLKTESMKVYDELKNGDIFLLLADGSHILWVVGFRISESCKVKEGTKHILKIKITKENKNGTQD